MFHLPSKQLPSRQLRHECVYYWSTILSYSLLAQLRLLISKGNLLHYYLSENSKLLHYYFSILPITLFLLLLICHTDCASFLAVRFASCNVLALHRFSHLFQHTVIFKEARHLTDVGHVIFNFYRNLCNINWKWRSPNAALEFASLWLKPSALIVLSGGHEAGVPPGDPGARHDRRGGPVRQDDTRVPWYSTRYSWTSGTNQDSSISISRWSNQAKKVSWSIRTSWLTWWKSKSPIVGGVGA